MYMLGADREQPHLLRLRGHQIYQVKPFLRNDLMELNYEIQCSGEQNTYFAVLSSLSRLRCIDNPYETLKRIPFLACCHPTFYVPPLLPRVSSEAESVVIADPGVFALGFVAAELSPEVVVVVVEPEVVSVFGEPEAFVLASAAVEPGVVSVADVAGPQACVDTPVAFDVLVPVSVFVVEVDSSGRPKFLAFPNVGHCAISSSSVEAGG